MSSNGVIVVRGKRGKGYSAVGSRCVSSNGVIVVIEVRKIRVECYNNRSSSNR